MRFRLPKEQATSAANGIGSLVSAVLNGDQLRAQAEAKAAPGLAQAAAQARKYAAEADGLQIKNNLAQQRPQMLTEAALNASGAVGPLRQALPEYIKTGNWGAPFENPSMEGPPEQGRSAPLSPAQAPAGFNDQILRAFMSTLAGGNLAAVDGGNSTADNIAKAAGAFNTQGLRDSILTGQMPASLVGTAQAAIEGKPLVSSNEYGVTDNFTGVVDASNPVAQRFGQYRTAQTGAQTANAAQSYASAKASNAQAGKYREEADLVRQKRQQADGSLPPPPAKPLPSPALKMQQEALDAIGVASGINADLSALETQIEEGRLSFGPVSNVLNAGRNTLGISNDESRNFGSFKSSLERLRNESLRLNSGVQTDGDAQRAWAELFANINDTNLVKQRLAEIKRINERGVQLQQLKVDGIRANYGLPPLDASPQQDVKPALNGGTKQKGPQPGAVEGGYRFKGGNPGDPKNWERVQ